MHRDSLNIDIGSKNFLWQKLDYIHFNRVNSKQNLAINYLDYYSPAWFYETGEDEFGFLNNLFLKMI